MRSRLLAFVTGCVATIAPAALGGTSPGALHVSVTVVRACRVSTDTPSVRIDCGSRPQPVQISQPPASVHGDADSSTRAVTIEF